VRVREDVVVDVAFGPRLLPRLGEEERRDLRVARRLRLPCRRLLAERGRRHQNPEKTHHASRTLGCRPERPHDTLCRAHSTPYCSAWWRRYARRFLHARTTKADR